MTITFFRISVYVEESHLSKRTMVGPMNLFFFFFNIAVVMTPYLSG